jgi:hypothetical protein
MLLRKMNHLLSLSLVFTCVCEEKARAGKRTLIYPQWRGKLISIFTSLFTRKGYFQCENSSERIVKNIFRVAFFCKKEYCKKFKK